MKDWSVTSPQVSRYEEEEVNREDSTRDHHGFKIKRFRQRRKETQGPSGWVEGRVRDNFTPCPYSLNCAGFPLRRELG